jgi:hypothetical protein
MKASRNQPSRPVRLLLLFFFGVYMLSTVLWLQYAGTRPKRPVSETGNVYELNTHGSRAYLTLRDCLWLYGTQAIGFGGPVTMYVVYLWRRGWVAPSRSRNR